MLAWNRNYLIMSDEMSTIVPGSSINMVLLNSNIKLVPDEDGAPGYNSMVWELQLNNETLLIVEEA